ncbi:MAG: hypothetical protein WAU01_00790 [Saprospiraceae bacterium]
MQFLFRLPHPCPLRSRRACPLRGRRALRELKRELAINECKNGIHPFLQSLAVKVYS